jgi:hypothetical protein
VRNGENGLLVPPRDPEALAQAIATLLGNKALRERMGAMGREIVLKEFRAELIAEATIAVYDRLLGTGAAVSLDRNDAVAHRQETPYSDRPAFGISRKNCRVLSAPPTSETNLPPVVLPLLPGPTH